MWRNIATNHEHRLHFWLTTSEYLSQETRATKDINRGTKWRQTSTIHLSNVELRSIERDRPECLLLNTSLRVEAPSWAQAWLVLSHSTQSSAGDIQTIKQHSTYNGLVNSDTLHTPLTSVSVSTGYRHPQYTFPFLNGFERSKLQSLLLNQGWMDLRSAETMNIGLYRIKPDSDIRQCIIW